MLERLHIRAKFTYKSGTFESERLSHSFWVCGRVSQKEIFLKLFFVSLFCIVFRKINTVYSKCISEYKNSKAKNRFMLDIYVIISSPLPLSLH